MLKSEGFPYLKSLSVEVTEFWFEGGGDRLAKPRIFLFEKVEDLRVFTPRHCSEDRLKRQFSFDLPRYFQMLYSIFETDKKYDYSYIDDNKAKATGDGQITISITYKLEYTEEGKRVRDERLSAIRPPESEDIS